MCESARVIIIFIWGAHQPLVLLSCGRMFVSWRDGTMQIYIFDAAKFTELLLIRKKFVIHWYAEEFYLEKIMIIQLQKWVYLAFIYLKKLGFLINNFFRSIKGSQIATVVNSKTNSGAMESMGVLKCINFKDTTLYLIIWILLNARVIFIEILKCLLRFSSGQF